MPGSFPITRFLTRKREAVPVMSEIEIELDDDLLEKTRRLAKETGRTVEQVIRDAIIAGTEREEDDSSEEGKTEG